MSGTDLKTQAFVLRRTNYGEADRILNLLTPEGKLSCLAKGVRKEKSKLAGGIELFTLSDVVLHNSSKSDLYLLTSAKMSAFYGNLISDLARFELASQILKELSRVTDQIDSPEFFDLLKQSLEGLNNGLNFTLVETWFNFNLARIKGVQINLISDTSGAPLEPNTSYAWDASEEALRPLPSGPISADEIKIMRLFLSSPLALASRIKNLENHLGPIHMISKAFQGQ